jgi:hypothetical protein
LLATAEDFGAVYVERRQVGPRSPGPIRSKSV